MTSWRHETQDYWRRQERRELAGILIGSAIRLVAVCAVIGVGLGLGAVACLWVIHFLSP